MRKGPTAAALSVREVHGKVFTGLALLELGESGVARAEGALNEKMRAAGWK